MCWSASCSNLRSIWQCWVCLYIDDCVKSSQWQAIPRHALLQHLQFSCVQWARYKYLDSLHCTGIDHRLTSMGCDFAGWNPILQMCLSQILQRLNSYASLNVSLTRQLLAHGATGIHRILCSSDPSYVLYICRPPVQPLPRPKIAARQLAVHAHCRTHHLTFHCSKLQLQSTQSLLLQTLITAVQFHILAKIDWLHIPCCFTMLSDTAQQGHVSRHLSSSTHQLHELGSWALKIVMCTDCVLV